MYLLFMDVLIRGKDFLEFVGSGTIWLFCCGLPVLALIIVMMLSSNSVKAGKY